jgi:hypothetical protein
MKIYQVEAQISGLSKDRIKQELSVIDQVLGEVGGGVCCAEPTAHPDWIGIVLRAKSERIVQDVLEATDFAIGKIACLGADHETYARKKMSDLLADFNPQPPLFDRHYALAQ